VLDVQLGFNPQRTETLRVDPPKRFDNIARANGFYDDVVRRVRTVPGITAAALSDVLPFAGDRSWGAGAEGVVYQRGQMPEAFIRVVSDGYFRTMGIPMRGGRDFGAGDGPESEPVVIMNETLARMLWPGRDAVGQAIWNGPRRRRVIAVVGDVRHQALEHAFTGELY